MHRTLAVSRCAQTAPESAAAGRFPKDSGAKVLACWRTNACTVVAGLPEMRNIAGPPIVQTGRKEFRHGGQVLQPIVGQIAALECSLIK